jgi:hypothetical protein
VAGWEPIVSIMRSKGLLASVGVATATVTTFAGAAPVVVSTAGAVDGADDANTIAAEPTTDGTFESCSAYFGYGKNEEDAVLELTTFPVAVEGGTPEGPAPTVENGGIDVVLVIEDVDGNELRCVPEEVSEDDWDDTWGGTPINFPPYPGPGHYPYPSEGSGGDEEFEEIVVDEILGTPAAIGDLGEIDQVSFEVVGVPEGYTLVDPVAATPLPMILDETFGGGLEGLIDEVAAEVALLAGPEAAAAWTVAINACSTEVEPPNADSPELLAAIQALADEIFVSPPTVESPVSCGELGETFFVTAFVLAVRATIANESPITVSLPVPSPTTAAPPAAAAVEVTPAFTG